MLSVGCLITDGTGGPMGSKRKKKKKKDETKNFDNKVSAEWYAVVLTFTLYLDTFHWLKNFQIQVSSFFLSTTIDAQDDDHNNHELKVNISRYSAA